MKRLVHARLLGLSLVVFFLLFAQSVISLAAEQPFTFRFNPPNNLSCVMTVKTTTMDSGPAAKRTEIATSSERLTFARTDQGYTVTHTPISADLTRNGKPGDKVAAAFLEAARTVAMDRDLDANGRCLGMRGQEEIVRKIQESLGNDAPPALLQNLPGIVDAAIAKDITEWNGRIAEFVGLKAKVGDVWATTTRVDTPGGEMELPTKTRFLKRVQYGGRNCVRIGFNYSSSSAALTKTMQELMKRVSSMTGVPPQYTILRAQMVGSGERLIDPATMMIFSEKISRNINLLVQVPGKGRSNVTMVEKRVYRYDYSK